MTAKQIRAARVDDAWMLSVEDVVLWLRDCSTAIVASNTIDDTAAYMTASITEHYADKLVDLWLWHARNELESEQ